MTSELTAEELTRALNLHYASTPLQKPKHVTVTHKIPYLGSGKIDRQKATLLLHKDTGHAVVAAER